MDEDLHRHVDELVAEEHALRARHADGSGLDPQERRRLEELEERLDQAWDLLRQREARRAAGLDVEQAVERPASVVEGYLN